MTQHLYADNAVSGAVWVFVIVTMDGRAVTFLWPEHLSCGQIMSCEELNVVFIGNMEQLGF